MASAPVSPPPLYLDPKSRFEAAKACYQQQTALLTAMTKFDLQIISGYLAAQLLVAGWAAKEPICSLGAKIGLSLIELVLMTVAVRLFWNSKTRRSQVSEVVQNLNRVLGYSVKSAYLEGVVVQQEFEPRYWFPWYVVAIAGSVVGVGFVLWWPH
jgi:hypothetical protein